MSIDPNFKFPDLRSSGSAMFAAVIRQTGFPFAPREREPIFEGARSINVTSLRDEEPG
jgi:hypothetical protein